VGTLLNLDLHILDNNDYFKEVNAPGALPFIDSSPQNFAYLSSVAQELDPGMDLPQEFVKVSSDFFARNGTRVAIEIGFSMNENDVSDLSLRRVTSLRSNVSTLTWKELGDRRSSNFKRIDPQSCKEIRS
jgi:hypothetical protein